MQGTMKQLVYVNKGEVELREVPIPDYGDDGILVKVAYCGICGSDLHAYTLGGLDGGIGPGQKFGHEFSGTIVEMGKNVKGFKIGDRVWIDPNYCEPGGTMASCQAGGFSEYCGALEVIENVSVFHIPDDVSMRAACLIEPFGVGVHTKNRCGVQTGDKVMMWGAGPIGLMGWAAMRHQGVEDIAVMERMPSRIEFAKKLGVDVYDNSEEDSVDIAEGIFDLVCHYPDSGDTPDIDRYIDYVGHGSIVAEFLDTARPHSTLATLGINMHPSEIVAGMFMLRELTVVGSRGYTPADIQEVIEVLQDKSIDIASIITGEFTLDQAKEAFEFAANRDNGMKTVFRIGGEAQAGMQ